MVQRGSGDGPAVNADALVQAGHVRASPEKGKASLPSVSSVLTRRGGVRTQGRLTEGTDVRWGVKCTEVNDNHHVAGKDMCVGPTEVPDRRD